MKMHSGSKPAVMRNRGCSVPLRLQIIIMKLHFSHSRLSAGDTKYILRYSECSFFRSMGLDEDASLFCLNLSFILSAAQGGGPFR